MIQVIIREQILSRDDFDFIAPRTLEQAAEETLANSEEKRNMELSIILGDDQEILELNRSFRGLDSVTDVLSFPAGDVDPDTGLTYLGDVVISFPQAVIQAKDAGHSVEAELQLLVVHGVLHLLGFDHEKEKDHKLMWDVQKRILEKLGCDIELLDI